MLRDVLVSELFKRVSRIGRAALQERICASPLLRQPAPVPHRCLGQVSATTRFIMLPDAVQLTGSTRAGQRSQSTIEVERMLRADILLALGRHRAEAISKLHVMQVVESSPRADLSWQQIRFLGLSGRSTIGPTVQAGLK
jgi:hypothetical protein